MTRIYYSYIIKHICYKCRSFDSKLQKAVSVDLPSPTPQFSSFVFANCSVPNFIIDLKSASADSALNLFLHQQTPYFFIGAGYMAQVPPHIPTRKLADSYDAMIFIKETTPTKDVVAAK